MIHLHISITLNHRKDRHGKKETKIRVILLDKFVIIVYISIRAKNDIIAIYSMKNMTENCKVNMNSNLLVRFGRRKIMGFH